MKNIDALRESLPDHARDLRMNLAAVLSESSLTAAQRWGVAVASAAASRRRDLLDAVVADARAAAGDAVVEDGLAASALMAMNNVFYRFKHFMGEGAYEKKPARLRMNRIAKTEGPKADFELYCLAVSAINGCEACVKAHEAAVLKAGMTEDHVWDAVRIASVVNAIAVSLEEMVAARTAALDAANRELAHRAREPGLASRAARRSRDATARAGGRRVCVGQFASRHRESGFEARTRRTGDNA